MILILDAVVGGCQWSEHIKRGGTGITATSPAGITNCAWGHSARCNLGYHSIPAVPVCSMFVLAFVFGTAMSFIMLDNLNLASEVS